MSKAKSRKIANQRREQKRPQTATSRTPQLHASAAPQQQVASGQQNKPQTPNNAAVEKRVIPQQVASSQRNKQQTQKNERYRSRTNWRPWITVGSVVLAVAVIVSVFFFLSRQSPTTGVVTTPTPTSPGVLQALTHVDPSVLAAVGTGSVQNLPQALHSQPPLKGPTGKPEFFYFGAEFCPYCAAERWAVVVALSRFGSFSRLNQTTSASDDVYPSTPTFTFYQSNYSSTYVDFVSIESTTNQRDSSGNYAPLQTPDTGEQQLITTYDAPPYVSSSAQGAIPFILIANQYLVSGPGYSPQVLTGLTWQEIANDLSNQTSPVSQGILGTANDLTAAICMTTNQQPASVCAAAPIPTIEQSLGKTSVGNTNMHLGFVEGSFEAIVGRV